jgi:hypothetical protein
MNWGHRLNELVTRNWREKIISLVLAFLFWFMIKAQDARQPASYAPSQAAKMMPQGFAPPSQLAPTVQPSPEVPAKLAPVMPSAPAVQTLPVKPKPEAEAAKPTGL